jgi:hypothetical protein
MMLVKIRLLIYRLLALTTKPPQQIRSSFHIEHVTIDTKVREGQPNLGSATCLLMCAYILYV